MRLGVQALAIVALIVLIPTGARAQAVIAGVVRDTSGAVLPGVTVEASSPALIEKVRTTVSDSGGQYPIEDVQSAKRQTVIGNDVLKAIPTVRSYNALVVVVPGVVTNTNDVATGTATTQ